MKVLIAASEAAPFCKTGGLADVAGSLPRALGAAGVETAVILPLYESVSEDWRRKMEFVKDIRVHLAWREIYCGLFRLTEGGVTWYFVDNEHYFRRTELYGYYDDGERFGFFSRAVAELLPHLDRMPDVVHCNDWQTALIPIYSKVLGLPVKTVLTVHNIEYQGRYGPETLEDLFGLPRALYEDGTLEYHGDVCLLKGGLLCADSITTVSPAYAQELRHPFYAHGLDGVLSACSHKLRGILNGIDVERYNPETDPSLFKNYSFRRLAGKAGDKKHLQKLLGLREEARVPLIACVSRLVGHKGMDLIQAVFGRIMELPVQFVLLGRGEWNYEQFFSSMQAQYPGRVSVNILYSESLSSAIYAGADMFLMPSKSEPCGLAQMIAMRYGTVPIVRETGGLKDTVFPAGAADERGNGFTFASYNADDMLYVVREAVETYGDETRWKELMKRGMTGDFSWSRSAAEYAEIYREICGG